MRRSSIEWRARTPRGRAGAVLVEYAVLIGVMAVALVGALTLLGDEVRALWDGIAAAFPTGP